MVFYNIIIPTRCQNVWNHGSWMFLQVKSYGDWQGIPVGARDI